MTLTCALILIAIGAGVLALLAAPVSLRFDSTKKHLVIRWLGLSLRKKYVREEPGKPGERVRRGGWFIRAMAQLIVEDRTLVCDMVPRFFRPLVSVIRAASVRDMEATFSVPDPMWNGLLHGFLANMSIKNVHLSTNFEHVNYVRGCLRFYPYRVLREAAGLLIRLPYGRIIRIALSRRKVSRKEDSP